MKQAIARPRAVAVLLSLAVTLAAAPAARAACPCSLWDPATTPANLVANDPNAVELGVRFRSAAAGQITALRFYKGASNGGVHVGNLWDGSGQRLATVTFTAETASGWQQASFETPVAVSANTVYIASYHTQVGNYSFDSGYFAASRDNPPLQAPASALVGGNGVYAYGALSSFPSQTFGATNYWVDVVFEEGPPDPPPPDEGPGGPLLILTSAGNPFTRYYAEILAAEGLNSYLATDVSHLSAELLQAHDLVVLGEMPLGAGQAALLADWVAGGGKLIAMRPDPQLAGLLGLSAAGGVISDGYLLVDGTSAPGEGIVGQTIQYHGDADRYLAAAATTIATLYTNATTPTEHPAVTWRAVGANGGQAAAFLYDLAKSVVYTRQGNPAWAATERDGSSPIRPNDLFFPDYVDLSRVAIPQADEQQRLLANLIHHLQLGRRPQPRFWYLPGGRKAVIVHALDDHNTGAGTVETFDKLEARSPAGCSVADWDCLRATSWGYTGINVTDAQAAAYQGRGFELGVHVNTGCQDWTPASLEAFFAGDLQSFASAFPSVVPQRTNRTHCIAWSDWASQPRVERAHGIRYDMNYYYWPGSWVAGRPGFFTGSGFPLRFADLDGRRIDVYQAVTQLVNENDLPYPEAVATMIDRALGPEGYYGVFGTHDDYRNASFSDDLITTALARGVALVSAAQMLDWVDGRNASTLTEIEFAGGVLTFRVSADPRARNLVVMIPAQAPSPLEGVTRDGVAVPFTTETVKGVPYALVPAGSGLYAARYVSAPPSGPVTLWPPSATPGDPEEETDPNAVELGVRFVADVDGYVKGIRFYKGSGNTGLHRGSLWSDCGERLATALFSGESESGWQEVLFAQPVAVQAGLVYVASYHAPAGRYAFDEEYFQAAYDNPPLHALATEDGGNGVYKYGTSSAFPDETYRATNYWVDVVFSTQP